MRAFLFSVPAFLAGVFAVAALLGVAYGPVQPAAVALQPAIGGFASVRDYGAIGDGTTDDIAAINRAIDALPAGIVYFPPGLYRISQPITPRGKSLIFAGAGWSTSTAAPCGDKEWSDLAVQSGSRILYVGKGTAFSFPVDYRLRYGIRDLAVLGSALSGSVGISVDYSTDVRNVLVANFDTGFATTAQACCLQVDSLDVRGCHVGVPMTQTNACVFNRLMISWCDVRALKMAFCAGNVFNALAVQGNRASPQIELTDDGTPYTAGNPADPGKQSHGCRDNRFVNLWSERGSQYCGKALTLKISPASYQNTFDGLCLHSGDGDQIDVAGPGNRFLDVDYLPWGPAIIAGDQAKGTIVSGTDIAVSGPGAGLVSKR